MAMAMAMGGSASGWDTAGALLVTMWDVILWLGVAVVAYVNWRPARPWLFQVSAGVIILGIIGQILHIEEHVASVLHWLQHPNLRPQMSPWGDALARGLGQVDPGVSSLGMEILHLTGNLIFLAGVTAIMMITRRAPHTRTRRWGKLGFWLQVVHVAEHLMLTFSLVFGAPQTIGLSTWFGLLPPGPGPSTYRLWWHAVYVGVGSAIFAITLYHLWRERRVIRATFQPQDSGSSAEHGTTPEGSEWTPAETSSVASLRSTP